MAFMEMVFKRDSKDRKISFADVATACEVKVSEVELLLMKSFSIKVVKGVIDEVHYIAHHFTHRDLLQPILIERPQ
jgi:hypothetical protein